MLLKFIALIVITTMLASFSTQKSVFDKRKRLKAVADNLIIDTLATGLTVPWEIVFLPDKTMLFTERNGKVRLYRDEKLLIKPALVLQGIDSTKKMGLLSICIHPQFSTNKYLYLSYNYRENNAPLLKIERYQFINDSLINPQTVLENIKASQNHTGCRLKFGPDGKLFITTGDADRPISAQDLKSLNGKILRVNDDGAIPGDNPFVGNDTVRKEIWSYGHRNTQGIDFQPGTNQLFNSEHGPSGGDEVNIIKKGANYGWPVIHHQDTKAGMVSPLLEYTPSIGPSQILFYAASAFPLWKGNLLVASLRGEKIILIQMEGTDVISQENLLEHSYGRIRALSVGPDGYIYFSTSQNDPPEGKPRHGYDMLLRLRPSSGQNKISAQANTRKKIVTKKVSVKKTPSVNYQQLCASCHGITLNGTDRAKSLVDGKWEYGSSKRSIVKNIKSGIIEKGMPAWEGTLTPKEIDDLTEFIITRKVKKP